jgi:phosphate transport system protein
MARDWAWKEKQMSTELVENALQELDGQVMRLGSWVDDALAQALEALETSDQDRAGAVVVADTPIDELHLAIEEGTFRVLALHQPVAGRELRHLMSLAPIAVDLERVGDEAEAIAQHVLRLAPWLPGGARQAESLLDSSREEGDHSPEVPIRQALLELGGRVRALLQQTMQAFADRDAAAARRLWEEDKMVARSAYVVRRDGLAMLEGLHGMESQRLDPHLAQRATSLLWISHELERAGDHCTNICERIVFLVQGETDMRPLPED